MFLCGRTLGFVSNVNSSLEPRGDAYGSEILDDSSNRQAEFVEAACLAKEYDASNL